MEEVNKFYKENRKIIKERLKEFKQEKTEQDYFYETCFCLMAVQSKGRNSDKVVQELKKKKYYKKPYKINELLRKHVRFHNNKSEWIKIAWNNKEKVLEIVNSKKTPEEKRELLLKEVKGFGMKEASHFLRNTGHTGLGILDRHILKNMKEYGAVKELPETLSKKNYLMLEEELKKFANKIKIDFDELDLVFWGMNTGEVFK